MQGPETWGPWKGVRIYLLPEPLSLLTGIQGVIVQKRQDGKSSSYTGLEFDSSEFKSQFYY